jgi:riboflavin synthase
VVEKGFITLDGASLTVTKVQDGKDGWWEVMLIPYTQEKVVIAAKTPGDHVNVEVDMVGKYVEKNVASYFEGSSVEESTVLEKLISGIVDKRLEAAGIKITDPA